MTSPHSSCRHLSKPSVEGMTDPVAAQVTGQVVSRKTPSVTGEVAGQVEAQAAQAEAQANEVLATFRDRVFTGMFPGRTDPPKTLIFAKDYAHADDIVRLCREVFGNPVAERVSSCRTRSDALCSDRVFS